MSTSSHLYLKLIQRNGTAIEGECETDGFEKQIVLEGWSWALKRSSTSTAQANGSLASQARAQSTPSRPAEPSVLNISKLMDRSTTGLLSVMQSSEPLRGELTLREGSEAELELTILLTNARIIGYELDGTSSDKSGDLMEEWSINYEMIAFDYKPNAKSAALNVTMRRSARASTATPKDIEDKIVTLLNDDGFDLQRWNGVQRSIYDKLVLRQAVEQQRPAAN